MSRRKDEVPEAVDYVPKDATVRAPLACCCEGHTLCMQAPGSWVCCRDCVGGGLLSSPPPPPPPPPPPRHTHTHTHNTHHQVDLPSSWRSYQPSRAHAAMVTDAQALDDAAVQVWLRTCVRVRARMCMCTCVWSQTPRRLMMQKCRRVHVCACTHMHVCDVHACVRAGWMFRPHSYGGVACSGGGCPRRQSELSPLTC